MVRLGRPVHRSRGGRQLPHPKVQYADISLDTTVTVEIIEKQKYAKSTIKRDSQGGGYGVQFQLGDSVPHLLNRAVVEIAHTFARDLDRFAVTLPMWRVLAALLAEGEQRLGDLARATSIELSTLSRIAATMDAKGLIRRRRSGQDARAVLTALTEEGRRVAEAIIPLARHAETSATAGMSDEEVRVLKALLQRLYGNVAGNGHLPGGGSRQ